MTRCPQLCGEGRGGVPVRSVTYHLPNISFNNDVILDKAENSFLRDSALPMPKQLTKPQTNVNDNKKAGD